MLKNSSLILIDKSIPDYSTLVKDVISDTQVIVLESDQEGIAYLTKNLQKKYNTIHLVSHGSPGCLYLGNTELNLKNIEKYAGLLQTWQVENILIYGCRVAEGDAGTEFIEKLHQLTGANIAASSSLTGNSARGGNWELEVIRGTIKPQIAFSQQLTQVYSGILETIVVNTLEDEDDGVATRGVSLRDAINRANALPGSDLITFDSALEEGTIVLTTEEPLRIVDDLRILGLGANQIAVDGNGEVNVFEVGDGFADQTVNVTIEAISIINGESGIVNWEELTILETTISGNTESGIVNENIINLIDSTVSGNIHSFSSGGGIENDGLANITNSTISGNSASRGGGIINKFGSTLNLTNSTISGNSASTGGGIYSDSSNSETIINSTITNNQADESRGSAIATWNAEKIEIGNSIIANNLTTDIDIINGDNVFTSLGGNIIGLGNAARIFTAEGDRVAIEKPGLGELADNDGATFTHLPLEDSLAIDAGLNDLVVSDTDQRGAPRISNDRVDIGAVEVLGAVIQGTNDDDFIAGTSFDDAIEGLGGNDTLRGFSGNDSLDGGADNDFLEGGPEDDTLRGGTGDDTIDAGRDRDVLLGGPDNDILNSGIGNDTLSGGTGRDEFQFDRLNKGVDTLLDFKPEADFLAISRSGFDSNLSVGFISEEEFLSIPRFTDLDESFTLGFVYAFEVQRLAYIDTEAGIPLTQFAILEDSPELEASNFRVF